MSGDASIPEHAALDLQNDAYDVKAGAQNGVDAQLNGIDSAERACNHLSQNGVGDGHDVPKDPSSAFDDDGINTHSEAPAESTAVGDPASDSSLEKAAKLLPRRDEQNRLWYIRMPQPPERYFRSADGPKDDANKELESCSLRIGVLNESLGVIRIERDAATQKTQAAQAELNPLRQAYEEHKAAAEPLRAERKQLRDTQASVQAAFKADYSDLPAKSEEDLDQKIYGLRHDMEHGGAQMSLADEKKCLAVIAKLESQRAKVQEYGDKVAAVREAKARLNEAISASSELETKVQLLWEHTNTQRAIVEECRAAENKVRAEYKTVQDEKSSVLRQQDELRARLYAARAEKYQRGRMWSENRKFNQRIRQMIKQGEGSIAEARELCTEQVEKLFQQLEDDPEFRKEYMEWWIGQRKHPTSAYEDQDDMAATSGTRKEDAAAEVAATQRAQKTIADVLARADEAARLQKQQQAGGAQDRTVSATAHGGGDQSDPSAASIAASAAAAAAVGNAPPAAAPKKSSKRSSRPPPPVVVPDLSSHTFELPSAAVKPQRSATSDSQQDKERIREQNRLAAAEAERRKERQRKAAEEKRRAAEARRARAENDKVAADKVSKQPVAASASASQGRQQSLTDADQSADSASAAVTAAIGDSAADFVSSAAAQGKQLVDEAGQAVSKPKQGAAGSGTAKQRSALPKSEPRARARVRRRNALKTVQKAAYRTSKVLQSAVQSAVQDYWPAMQGHTNLILLVLPAVCLLCLIALYFML